jgi:hypothetical protein
LKITRKNIDGLAGAAILLASVVLSACSPGTPAATGRDDGADAGSRMTPSASETCGNGLDDDGNGAVDDGCACAVGETQSCWPGDPSKRNNGLCGDGSQTCQGTSAEFASWGPCIGYIEPVVEIPGNCADEDCDGTMPGCGESCGEFEVCGNGVDDDCDGYVDCMDADAGCDCPGYPDDGGTGTCPPGEDCLCEDRCVPGAWRYCDEPAYCYWGRQDCAPDGRWGACVETTDIPSGCEDSFPIPLPIDIGTTYDPDCCVAAGFCCQNFGYDRSLDIDASVGNCDAAVETVCTPR